MSYDPQPPWSQPCPDCNGWGRDLACHPPESCTTCNGTGLAPEEGTE